MVGLHKSLIMLSVFALCACAHAAGSPGYVAAEHAKHERAVRALEARPTADNLTAAALLSWHLDDAPGAIALIEKAETLAPKRPELLWAHLELCRRLKCAATAQIETRLAALDPDNGFVWLPVLARAQAGTDEAAVTQALERMSAAPRLTLYWNELVVLMVDASAVTDPASSLAARGIEAIGVLAAQVTPPLQPLSTACRSDRFGPGRRAACEALAVHMEDSGTWLTQGYALSLQQRLWPDDAHRAVVNEKRRRLDYVMMTAASRRGHGDRDMAVRIEAARRTSRETDVAYALVRSYGLPTEPPPTWKDPMLY